MADTYQLKREVAWHTEEMRRLERELDAANHKVPELRRTSEQAIRDAEREVRDLKRKVEDTKRKLGGYVHDLAREEAANDNDPKGARRYG